jgi:A118 family predicted phage portal protein
MKKWISMYVNQADWLNEDSFKPIRSLQLPATISNEIARLTTLEMEVEFSGGKRAEFFEEQFKPLLKSMKKNVEMAEAMGGMIFKPYLGSDEKSMPIEVVYAIYPVSFDANQKMTACVFPDVLKRGQYYYTRLELHEMGEFIDDSGEVITGCKIRNAAFRSTSKDLLGNPVSLADVEEWREFLPERIIKDVKQLLIGYFRPPIANNIDTNSPVGVSCYARAAHLIEQADRHWSNLIWEFTSGERAIYVDEQAFDKDTNGKPKLPNNRLYRPLDSSANIGEGKKLFEEWSPEFRHEALSSGLNSIFKRIEFNVGLAYGTLSDPQEVDKTATEVINAKQRSASTVVDNQKALAAALDDLFYAMPAWMDALYIMTGEMPDFSY